MNTNLNFGLSKKVRQISYVGFMNQDLNQVLKIYRTNSLCRIYELELKFNISGKTANTGMSDL